MFADDRQSSRAAALLRLGVLLAAFVAVLALTSRVFAQGPPSCPDRDAVRAALSALAGDAQSRAAFTEVERAELKLEDLGERYRVTVNGRSREYSDPARDCKARAQVAAVFTALVLNPNSEENAEPQPESTPQPPPPPPRPPVKPAPPPPPSRAPIRRVDMRLGASESLAFSGDGVPHTAGVLLRGAYAFGALGVELGVVLPASGAELAVGPAQAKLLRYPIDLSGRFGFPAGPLGVDLEAGAVLSVLELRDESNGAGPPATRLEPGLRLGAGLRLREPRVSPALGIFCSWIPVRYPLALEPSGVLAHSPTAWLGAWAGLSVAFD